MATACSRLLIAWVITRSPHELTAQVTRRIAEQLPAETKAAWASKDKSALTKMRRRTSSKKMLQSANADQQKQMVTDLRGAIAEGMRGIGVNRIRAALHRCRTNSYFPKPEYQKAGRLLQVIAVDSDADCAIGEEGGVIGFSSLRQTSWTLPGPISQCIQGQSPYSSPCRPAQSGVERARMERAERLSPWVRKFGAAHFSPDPGARTAMTDSPKPAAFPLVAAD